MRGTVTSRDGTAIGHVRLGAGPPVVVCHGSFAAAQDWVPFARALAATHTVHLYDRRGRGASPATSGAAVDAEVDDLAAVVDLAGPGAAVLGHSFGGGCALAFATRARFPGPVLLYEPRHSIDAPVSAGRIPQVRRLLATADPDVVVREVLATVIRLPAADIEAVAGSPLWARMRETVGAFPDELALLDTLTWQPGDLDGIAGPTWLLIGEDSPVLPADREGALRGILPGVRRLALPGMGHFGYRTSPADLARVVRHCLQEVTA